MELSAVLLARSIAMLDINDLNPRGTVFFPAIVPPILERFDFQAYPQKSEDFDEGKGISFSHGYFSGQSIDNITVYSDGIKIETRSSTLIGQTILLDTLGWLSEIAGISFSDKMITRWGYVSQLSFYSEIDLVSLHSAMNTLSDQVSDIVSERLGIPRKFSPDGFALDFDKVDGQIPMSHFSIQRRSKAPHDNRKFYSAAPLQTEDHIRLIEEFEHNLGTSQ